jgi:hypothetical protein
MKRYTPVGPRHGFVTAIVLVLAVLLVGRVAAAGATVTLNPPAETIAPGGDFATEVMIQDADAVLGFQFDAVFDAEMVELTGFELGPWLGSTGRSPAPLGPAPSRSGSGATIGGYTLGAAETPGASGDGLLATLRWKAKGTGDTELKLENLQLAGANGAALEGQVSAEPLKVTIGGSSTAGLPTDFAVPLLVLGAVLVVGLVGYFLLARRRRTTA